MAASVEEIEMTWRDLQGMAIYCLFVPFLICALAVEMIPDRDCGSNRAQTERMGLLPGSETTITPAEWRQSID